MNQREMLNFKLGKYMSMNYHIFKFTISLLILKTGEIRFERKGGNLIPIQTEKVKFYGLAALVFK